MEKNILWVKVAVSGGDFRVTESQVPKGTLILKKSQHDAFMDRCSMCGFPPLISSSTEDTVDADQMASTAAETWGLLEDSSQRV